MPSVRTLIDRGIYHTADSKTGIAHFERDAINEVGLGDYPDDIGHAVFQRAWDAEHSSGLTGVLSQMHELATLVKHSVRILLKGNRASWSTSLNSLSLLVGRYESAVKDGMPHLPAVTDTTLRDLHELHTAMSSLNWLADEED